MAEIEFAVLAKQCLDRHIPAFDLLYLDFCSGLLSIAPSFEGLNAVEYLQNPTRFSRWRWSWGTRTKRAKFQIGFLYPTARVGARRRSSVIGGGR
jgi:hypothetical protein